MTSSTLPQSPAAFDRSELIDLARRIDAGFDGNVLAEVVGMLVRYADGEIREYGALRDEAGMTVSVGVHR